MKIKGEKKGRKGHLSVATQVLQVAPSLFMVEVRKAGGDTLEFHNFYKNLSAGIKDIVWKTDADQGQTSEQGEKMNIGTRLGTHGHGSETVPVHLISRKRKFFKDTATLANRRNN
ncbi:hypothetical protein KP509_1Z183000 [Ceratopteris richardii]|nr:hypothetical protein KP509_1Z183000 [Ceratopteris richardii]